VLTPLEDMNAQSKYPVFGVIKSGVLALKNHHIKRDEPILIIATRATITSNQYQEALANWVTPILRQFKRGYLSHWWRRGYLRGRFWRRP